MCNDATVFFFHPLLQENRVVLGYHVITWLKCSIKDDIICSFLNKWEMFNGASIKGAVAISSRLKMKLWVCQPLEYNQYFMYSVSGKGLYLQKCEQSILSNAYFDLLNQN